MTVELTETATPATATISIREKGEVSQSVTVMAQPTGTPGLVITPGVCDNGFSGYFILTHAPSGYAVGRHGDDIYTIQRIADALAELPIDWTADKDTVLAAINEHSEALSKAYTEGRYQQPQADPENDPKSSEIAPYPRTEAQATADALARHLTRSLQYKCRETWTLIKRRDHDGRQLYLYGTVAKVTEWALVTALRSLAKHDQQLADGIARDVWQGWEDGSTIDENVYEWASEYGIPPLPDERSDAADESAGA